MTSAVNTMNNGAASAPPMKPLKSLPPLWTPPDRPAPVKPRRPLRHPRRKRNRTLPPPLRFSPTAWAKLVYLRDAGPTEIGGFGITLLRDRASSLHYQRLEERNRLTITCRLHP